MRRVISEFMEPTIERLTKDRENFAQLLKYAQGMGDKVETIESVVFKKGQRHSAFEEINVQIAENERKRRMENE